jgi:hypothetical protein
MDRKAALPYISFCLDDSLNVRELDNMPKNARLIGWQCGFEPLFVAVWSYMGFELDGDSAIDIATDYLRERKWFGDNEREPDYVI